MAVFLKLDGIEGESTDARHAKEIDVTAWSLGVTNAGSGHAGGGGGAGRPKVTDLAVSKLLDRASPALMLAVASGRHVRSGVLVTACRLTDTADPDRPVENVSLAFGKIHVAYTQQAPDGGPGSVSQFGWDVDRNAPL